jgi:hypothetical protein
MNDPAENKEEEKETKVASALKASTLSGVKREREEDAESSSIESSSEEEEVPAKNKRKKTK